MESFRTGVNTKGFVPTCLGRRVIEENRGNTDLDEEEDDSGRGVRPIYNTSLETLEGLLGTQVTRKDRSRTPQEKTPDNKKEPPNPSCELGNHVQVLDLWTLQTRRRVQIQPRHVSSWSRRLERAPHVPKSVSIPKH